MSMSSLCANAKFNAASEVLVPGKVPEVTTLQAPNLDFGWEPDTTRKLLDALLVANFISTHFKPTSSHSLTETKAPK